MKWIFLIALILLVLWVMFRHKIPRRPPPTDDDAS